MKALKRARMAAPLALLLCGLGSPGLYAQAAPDAYFFKFRTGLTAGDVQATHFDNKIFGFGLEARKGGMFGLPGALAAELGWEFVPGRHYSVMQTVQGDVLDDLKPLSNFDARKEYGQGFTLKAAYSAPLTIPYVGDLEWFAGLGLGMHSVRTEIEYTLFHPSAPGDWPAGTADSDKKHGDSFVEQSMAISPSLFGGLRLRVGNGTFCELSLRNFGMRHHEFTPGIYSGRPREEGKLDSGTSRGWSCEFALSVKI